MKLKAVQIAGGEHCPKCRRLMKRYQHSKGWMPRPGRNYYIYWDRCNRCQHFQHYESAKRFASTDIALEVLNGT